MTRRYGLFDAGTMGPDLVVMNGGTLLTTTASGLNTNRTARSTVSVQEDDSDVEFIVFGFPYGDAPSITGKVSIGLCTEDFPLSGTDMGGEATSIAIDLASGDVRWDNGTIATTSAGALGDVVKLVVSFDGEGGGSIGWYRNGALLVATPIPATMEDVPLFFAVSLGSDAGAGDIRVAVNSGATQLEFPTPNLSGWWEAPALAEAVRVATFPYLSRHDDEPACARWEDGITAQGFVERRGFNIWWWGDDRQVQGSVLALQLTDPDGRFDFLLGTSYRDQPVTLQAVDHADALTEATSLGTYYFDRCEANDDLSKTVYLRDIISLMDLRLQPRRFRPDIDPQTANRMHATLIGVAGSIPVALVNADGNSSEAQPIFQICGQDVEAIGKVREAGVPLQSGVPFDPLADYWLLTAGQQLQLAQSNETGEITLDGSRTGAAYEPPSPVDAIGGDGDPFTGDPGTGDFDEWDAFEDNGSLIVDHKPYYDPFDNGRAFFPQEPGALSHIAHKTDDLVAGTRYLCRFTVHQMQGPIGTSVSQSQVGITYGDGQFGRYFNVLSNHGPFPKSFEFTFEALTTHRATVYYAGNNVSGGAPCILDGLEFIELPPLDDTGDDTAVEDALPTLGLEACMRMVIEDLGGMQPSVWSAADAAAIDTDTGYAGGGIYFEDQTTRREALELLMPGYTAGIYRGRDGTLRVARMVLPEEAIGSDPIVIEKKDLLSPLIPRPDHAPGLSRQIGVRRNHRLLRDADVDTAGLTLTQRARLARLHRYILATGANFAPGYDHVDANDPRDSHLWFPADGQDNIDLAGRAYAIGRAFYATSMPFRDDIDMLTPVLLKYDRYGLEAGVPALALPIVEDRVNGLFVEIEFWAAAPFEEWQ